MLISNFTKIRPVADVEKPIVALRKFCERVKTTLGAPSNSKFPGFSFSLYSTQCHDNFAVHN